MADKDKLIAYPLTEELVYRSNIDVRQLNSMIKSIDESILRAMLRGTELSEKINRLSLGVISSYQALEQHHQIFNNYPIAKTLPSGIYGGVAYCSAFNSSQGGRQHSAGGIVTMSWEDRKKTSKIPVYDGVVNPSVSIYVDSQLRQVGDPVYNILDGDPTNFWVEPTTSGIHTLELQLPPSITKKFNYIEIVPFPIFGMEIVSIEYFDLQSVSHKIYPTQDTPFYNASGPIVMHLTPREYNNTIKINFNVKNGIDTMGFSHIDISSIDYLDTSTTIYLPFENIPQKDHTGSGIITDINPVYIDLDFYIDGAIEEGYDSFISEIALIDNIDSPTEEIKLKKTRGLQDINVASINVSQLSGDNALFLKMVINEVNLTTPVIRGASLTWKEV